MKKFYTSLLLAIMGIITLNAQTFWKIGTDTYQVDTLYHATIGPGMTETQLHMHLGAYNGIFYVAKIDLNNEYNDMRVVSAGDTVNGLANVYQLATKHDTEDIQQIVGVNSDFFSMNKPTEPAAGYVVSDGKFYGYGGYGADFSSYFIYSEGKKPEFARSITFDNAIVDFNNGTTFPVYINKVRGADQAIVFTRDWGTTTRTNVWGAEMPMKFVGSNKDFFSGNNVVLEATGPLVGDVTGNPAHGNMAIPENGVVFSGVGSVHTAMYKLGVGSRIKVKATMLADGKEIHPLQMVGGSPIMLKNGEVDSARVIAADASLNHLLTLQPRTAVGCSEDGKTLILIVADGRRTDATTGISNGVKTMTLGHIMKYLGCHNAMNFDGGGSSQFYVKGFKGVNGCLVRNFPVGGTYLRPVSNGLFAVSKAPKDETIASIEIREKNVKLSTGETYTPVVYGYNQYGVLVNPDVKDFTIKATDALGKVSGNTLTASSLSQSGTLTATCGTATYTIPVYVNGGTGVNTVIYDEDINAPVEYFTLQGMRINEPAKGQVVIVRQGSKVSKQLF